MAGPGVATAASAWKCLQGAFCIYKPPRTSLTEAMKFIPLRLAKDLNSKPMPPIPPRVEVTGSFTKNDWEVEVLPDWSMHPAVLGPRYLAGDISLCSLTPMNDLAQGVCVLGVNRVGASDIAVLKAAQLISTYVISIRLGVTTSDAFYTGRPIEKTSYDHVTRGRLSTVLTKYLGYDQPRMINKLGVHPDSQETYEMLKRDGVARPANSKEAVVLSIRVGEFAKPWVKLEVSGVNLSEEELLELVNNIAFQLNTSAHTVKLRCIRQGPFSLDMALLRKHWNLDPVLENIAMCQRFVPDDMPHFDKQGSQRLLSVADYDARSARRLQMLSEAKARARDAHKFLLADFEQDQHRTEYMKNLPPHYLV